MLKTGPEPPRRPLWEETAGGKSDEAFWEAQE